MEGIASPTPALGGEKRVGIHDCEEPAGQCTRGWKCRRNTEFDNIFLSQENSTHNLSVGAD
jgi:hypothetical protein